MLKYNDWMDEETKKAAKAKVNIVIDVYKANRGF